MARGRIAAVVGELGVGTPAQQLVDRFLLGFPRRGEWRPPAEGGLVLQAPAGAVAGDAEAEIARRAADFGLARAADPGEAVSDAEAVLVVPRGAGHLGAEDLLEPVLRAARGGGRCFVHGALARDAAAARRLADLAASRKVALLSGTCLPATWRLPPADLEHGAEAAEALIAVVGAPGEAELLGLDGLLPVTERRRGGESGVRSVVAFLGDAVWEAGGAGRWPRGLLGAALSRSDSPQGDALADGRTQDLVGLGLVPRLARDPAAYAIEHSDGLRSCVLVLNGVVNDLNFAIGLKDGGEVSAQLYRPPAPASHCFSALAEVVDEFFETGIPPWPAERAVLVAGLLDAFRRARARPGDRLETPELSIAYKAPERSAFRRA